MLINLKVCAAKAERQTIKIEIEERLPVQIISPCTINCQFNVKAFNNYYIITLDVDSILTLICQRCLNEFTHPYSNQTRLAVCNSDKIAEKLMDQYECVDSYNDQVNLKELLSDELYLYGPEFHPEINDCDNEVKNLLAQKIE